MCQSSHRRREGARCVHLRKGKRRVQCCRAPLRVNKTLRQREVLEREGGLVDHSALLLPSAHQSHPVQKAAQRKILWPSRLLSWRRRRVMTRQHEGEVLVWQWPHCHSRTRLWQQHSQLLWQSKTRQESEGADPMHHSHRPPPPLPPLPPLHTPHPLHPPCRPHSPAPVPHSAATAPLAPPLPPSGSAPGVLGPAR